MAFILLAVLVVFTAPFTFGAITENFACTVNNAGTFAYSPTATICENAAGDTYCKAMYVESATGVGYPSAGNDVQRPFKCYTNKDVQGGTASNEFVKGAIQNCAKTCGMCCLTSAYNCSNVQFPRLNCDTIVPSQCTSTVYRPIIAADCPTACGLCQEGGCVDAITLCSNDITICTNVDMQSFVNQYCQKTCARCSSTGNPPCTYNKDSTSSCAAWAKNGFCTNDFYALELRKKYCATTCKIC